MMCLFSDICFYFPGILFKFNNFKFIYFPGDRDQAGAGGQGGGVLPGVHPAEDGEGRGVQGEDAGAETRA